MPGNDGRARVQVPDELHPPRTGLVRTDSPDVVHALEGHIATLKADNDQLKAQLVAAEARADKAIADLVALVQQRAPTPAPAEAAAERERLAEVEAAAVPALRDTVAALKAALDSEQARNRELRRSQAAQGDRRWRWWWQKAG
jgi:hypothetical protein